MPNAKDTIYAGDLLTFAKTNVRNLAIAITETATPEIRMTLEKNLHEAIQFHAQVFNYMHARGLYPAYDVGKTIESDLLLAQLALSIPTNMEC